MKIEIDCSNTQIQKTSDVRSRQLWQKEFEKALAGIVKGMHSSKHGKISENMSEILYEKKAHFSSIEGAREFFSNKNKLDDSHLPRHVGVSLGSSDNLREKFVVEMIKTNTPYFNALLGNMESGNPRDDLIKEALTGPQTKKSDSPWTSENFHFEVTPDGVNVWFRNATIDGEEESRMGKEISRMLASDGYRLKSFFVNGRIALTR